MKHRVELEPESEPDNIEEIIDSIIDRFQETIKALAV